jgi:hypothetical protein
MSVSIKNGAPRYIHTGIRDESGRALPVVREAIPQHLPLIYAQTQRGPLTPQLVAGKDMMDMYGAKSFEERSKYFSHQTMAATICNGNGNAVMLKRVIAANAARASLVLFCEIVEDDIQAYEREADGEVMRDVTGAKMLHPTDVVDGYRVRWSIQPLADIDNLRGELKTVGTLVGRTGVDSQKYPIAAFRLGYGEYGNNVGLRLSYPGLSTAQPTDVSVIESQRGMIYRGQFVEREDAYSLPRVVGSVNAEQFIDFGLKEDLFNPKTDQDLGFSRLISEYQSIDPSSGFMPKYGPMESMYIYQDNIEEILDLLYVKEEAANPGAVADRHMLNLFNALDYNDIDHYSFVIDGSSIQLNENTTHYAVGGSDGSVDELTLDELVRDECLYNWENIEYPLLDDARYPFSIVYDTGFTLETKKAIIGTLGYRKDISVTGCTQDVLESANSISEETSIMTALRAYARLIPESTLWGTPVCRYVCVGHTGDKLHSKYRRQVPLVMELIEKRSKYMGAGSGKYKNQFAYDVAPANRIETMNNVNHPWKPNIVRSKDWEVGLNWVQYADRSQLFFPAIQTIYDDDTSVLNNDINMLIAVDVGKMSIEVWRQMTGNTTLTNEQFIDACNALLLRLVEGRYDNRVVIEPNTYFTEADEARGYSWTMDVAVYMNNMRTVGVINVITRRRSDL